MKGLNIGLTSYDDIFKTDEERKTEEIRVLPLSELHPFEEQPFKVLMDESMSELAESIKQQGVLSPAIVRPRKEGGYEILSGHRRVKACELAGIGEIPAVVKNLDDDEATILLVDSNLQRENILPSEKAYAYQMKLEAMKRKAGRPSKENLCQIGTDLIGVRSDKILSENADDSPRNIQRYIRLTNLIDPLLQMVDDKKIAMSAAVELSYLGTKEQSEVLSSIEREETSPSIAQAAKIRRFSGEGRLNPDVISSIIQEQKPESIKITLSDSRLKKYFPKNYTKQQVEDTIIKLLENWSRKRSHEQER